MLSKDDEDVETMKDIKQNLLLAWKINEMSLKSKQINKHELFYIRF